MKLDLKEQFVQAIQTHQGLINSLCQVYFTSKEDQQDIRQEIILQLWKAYPNFKGQSKVSTWMYKVSLHTILNYLRKNKNIPEKTNLNSIELVSTISFTDDDQQQLLQIISLLKPTDKALVILYLEGYNHKEIANTLDTSANNVSKRLGRIKKRLRTLYKIHTHESK